MLFHGQVVGFLIFLSAQANVATAVRDDLPRSEGSQRKVYGSSRRSEIIARDLGDLDDFELELLIRDLQTYSAQSHSMSLESRAPPRHRQEPPSKNVKPKIRPSKGKSPRFRGSKGVQMSYSEFAKAFAEQAPLPMTIVGVTGYAIRKIYECWRSRTTHAQRMAVAEEGRSAFNAVLPASQRVTAEQVAHTADRLVGEAVELADVV